MSVSQLLLYSSNVHPFFFLLHIVPLSCFPFAASPAFGLSFPFSLVSAQACFSCSVCLRPRYVVACWARVTRCQWARVPKIAVFLVLSCLTGLASQVRSPLSSVAQSHSSASLIAHPLFTHLCQRPCGIDQFFSSIGKQLQNEQN